MSLSRMVSDGLVVKNASGHYTLHLTIPKEESGWENLITD